ncbi:MAG: UbiD family decarboxylase [Phycisphaerales bacterium]|nr:UbiD family decarboxylase [Phycisphaerales bacterium]
MYGNLREFVAALERAGELARVTRPVSPLLEITAIAERMSRTPAPSLPAAATRRTDPRFHHLGGRAVLCERVEGSDIPVLINSMGSYRRMEMALGAEGGLEALADRLGRLVKPESPPTLLAKLRKVPELLELARLPPRRVRSGICQEVVHTGDAVDLTMLPLLRCWPLDGDLAAVGWPAKINDGVPGVRSDPEWLALHRGRYITMGGVYTIHAGDAGENSPQSRNIGMYRVQMLGPRTMAMHWHMHHDGARHWRSWKAIGKPMPVAIALGGESVLPYAATAPMPPGISELLLAGFLNRGAIPLVRAKTVPLDVPANAEIVIEGYVSHEAGETGFPAGSARRADDAPRVGSESRPTPEPAIGVGSESRPTPESAIGVGSESRPTPESAVGVGSESRPTLGPGAVVEGPFGDHTGYYSLPDRYPVLTVTAITHRRDPIFPATVVGLPPQEDYFMGKATERLFLPLLRTIIPDISDYDLPMFGVFHSCAFVKIRKEYPLQARRVMHAVWGAGQMAWTKIIVAVDEDVDVHDTTEVMRSVGERCVPARDTELVRGPLDILDHAAPFLGAGGKMGLDATRKSGPAEEHRALAGLAAELCAAVSVNAVTGGAARATERRVKALQGVLDARVPDELGGWWLLVRAAAATPGRAVIKALGGLADEAALPRWSIVVGPDADVANIDDALFHWAANSSPDRDRVLSACGRRVAFDATPKPPGKGATDLPVRDWPPIIEMNPAVRARVDAAWSDL